MRQRHGEKPSCGHRDRKWRDIAVSQGMPRTGGHRQSLKRQGKIPSRVLGEPGPADTLLSDVWPPEPCKNTFALFPASQSVALCCGSPRALKRKSPMELGDWQRPYPWQETIRKGVYLLPEQKRQTGPQTGRPLQVPSHCSPPLHPALRPPPSSRHCCLSPPTDSLQASCHRQRTFESRAGTCPPVPNSHLGPQGPQDPPCLAWAPGAI